MADSETGEHRTESGTDSAARNEVGTSQEPDGSVAGVDAPKSLPARPWRRIAQILATVVRYPRVSIQGALAVGATVLAFFILPNEGTATPPASLPIFAVELQRPSNIPAYVLFGDSSLGEHVAVGMDVPAHTKVTWSLLIVYDDRDSIVNQYFGPGLTSGGTSTSSQIGIPGKDALTINGTTHGSNGYTEMKLGYFPFVQQNAITHVNNPSPTDLSDFEFNLSGPAQVSVTEGATVAVSMPTILVVDEPATGPSNLGAEASPFASEDAYSADKYENLTGGPTLESGGTWDWFTNGDTLSAVATGVDNAEQQSDQNKIFAAAVLFGLAVAAATGFLVELADAVQKARRARRPARVTADEPPP